MILSKVPFRISIVGGGTDFEDYYKNDYGQVISTTINKYMYVIIIPRFENQIHIRYSKTEIVDNVNDIKHPIIREGLKMFNIESNIEIVIMSDIPAHGSGLGSSSALAVGLIQALSAYTNGNGHDKRKLAHLACELEIVTLNEPIGRQDQYAVAFGGLNHIIFSYNEISVKSLIKRYTFDYNRVMLLRKSIMLFYLGTGKKSGDILIEHKNNIALKQEILDKQLYLVDQFLEWYKGKYQDSYIGELVNRSWNFKTEMSNMATCDYIEQCRNDAIYAGAWGCKVCGSGGGGFMMIMCHPKKQDLVRKKLSYLKELTSEFEVMGAKLSYV